MKHFRLFLAVVVFAVVAFLLRDQFLLLSETSSLNVRIQDAVTHISTPDPLRGEDDFPDARLTRQGIISSTNSQRGENNLPPLVASTKLHAAAMKKVQDMFLKQYFAHVSPDGRQASDLASDQNYEYIAIGENLALGNFENDKILVQAWMDSPGHRANILDRRFREIGVAAARGIYEGRTTWLAVQIFALPKSPCPPPSESSKNRIDSNEKTLDYMQNEITRLKNEIETMRPGAKRGEYNAKIAEHNELVGRYNALVEITRNLISTFNKEVDDFNACLRG